MLRKTCLHLVAEHLHRAGNLVGRANRIGLDHERCPLCSIDDRVFQRKANSHSTKVLLADAVEASVDAAFDKWQRTISTGWVCALTVLSHVLARVCATSLHRSRRSACSCKRCRAFPVIGSMLRPMPDAEAHQE